MHSYLRLGLAMMVTANLYLPSLRTWLIEPLRQMGGNKKKYPITICVDGAKRLTREKPFACPSVLLSERWL